MPVVGSGRLLATTFWGRAWCSNLERYHDFANRLPRGRTYLRQGAVVDLEIATGLVTALVSGSELYEVTVEIGRLPKKRWNELRGRCAGGLASVVELLEGRIGDDIMTAVTDARHGLFPEPRDIALQCSCPDWAQMCKHVAAALYGVGLRLDEKPRMLFELRGVDPDELVGASMPGRVEVPKSRRLDADLTELFGVHIDDAAVSFEGAAEGKTNSKQGKAAARAKAHGNTADGKGSRKKGPTKKAATKKAATKKAATKKAATKKAATKKAVTKKAATKKAATKKAATKKPDARREGPN